MPFPYISVEDAIKRPGLRMVVVGGVPSPWGEAAKGLLHMKRIDWAAVRLVYDSEALKDWAGERSGPVAIYDDEKPRSRWNDILLLAERLSPGPALLPKRPRRPRARFRAGARNPRRGRARLVTADRTHSRRPAKLRRLPGASVEISRQEIRLQPCGRQGRPRSYCRAFGDAFGAACRAARRRQPLLRR